jgi:hypothetical protein
VEIAWRIVTEACRHEDQVASSELIDCRRVASVRRSELRGAIMPFSTTISALDFSSGLANVRVSAGYVWNEVGGPNPGERKQAEVALDVTSTDFLRQASPVTFSYAGSLAPLPSPAWFIGMWIQEIPAIASGAGWLFRSGGFDDDPPSLPLEVILAPEEMIGAAELSSAIGSLPQTSGTTTITALSLTVAGADVALTATGTDTQLPAGDTFTYTATLVLDPGSRVLASGSPFDVRLTNPSLTFTAAPGTGLATALLNALSGLIERDTAFRVKSTVESRVNSGVLMAVATRVNRGVPSSMPAGVVLSIRGVRATTRTTPGGTESVIGVRSALAAFGGVLNKFPALATASRCFIATAAFTPTAPEVEVLTAWRDHWLCRRRGGQRVIAVYERFSPPLARFVARSALRRALARTLIVTPGARLARWVLGQDTPQLDSLGKLAWASRSHETSPKDQRLWPREPTGDGREDATEEPADRR